jgi:hypothetical protein
MPRINVPSVRVLHSYQRCDASHYRASHRFFLPRASVSTTRLRSVLAVAVPAASARRHALRFASIG